MKSDLEKLQAIIEASKKLTSVLDLDELLNVILDVALTELEAERGTVFLLDREKNEIFSRILRGDEMDEIRQPIGQGISGCVAASGKAEIIPDAYADPRFDPETDRRSGFRTRSILCLPLRRGDDEILGVIQLLNKQGGSFTSDDADYLEALAAHMVIALENARAHLERLEQERTRQELQLAAQIQKRLLPQKMPRFPGLWMEARTIPCHWVGGDYYDFIALPQGGLGLIIADVSGKGVPAALITSALHAYLHASIENYTSPAALAARLNLLLYDSILPASFLTMVFLEVDPQLRWMRYCNCGHNPPIMIQNGKSITLGSSGTIVGMFPDAEFGEKKIPLAGGERLLLYTDGLTEATRESGDEGEEFGLQRLIDLCRDASKNPHAWLASIDKTLTEFTARRVLEDDLTLIALCVWEPGTEE